MQENKNIFGTLNIIDFALIIVLILAISGIFLVRAGKISTNANIVQEKKEVEFDVILRAKKVSSKEEIFKAGDKSFITIRNVPYTKLEIINVKKTRWQTIIPNPENLEAVIALDDPSAPYTYNFLVTLKDKAAITEDGAVIGGNKIKIGLHVILEGFNYKLNGVVSDIRIHESPQGKE